MILHHFDWRSLKNNHTTNIHEIVKEDYINKYNSKHNFPDKFLNKMTDYAIYKYWNEKFRPNDNDEYRTTILEPLQKHRKSVKEILNKPNEYPNFPPLLGFFLRYVDATKSPT